MSVKTQGLPTATGLQALLDHEARVTHTHSVLLGVQSGNGRIDFQGAAGAASPDQPFFMASITKMFTATVLLQLVDEGRLRLDDRVAPLLPQVDLTGLHRWRGVDRSDQLTLRHLVHQTSGLADYFEGGLSEELNQGKDGAYGLDEVLAKARQMKPLAALENGRSHYSDTNFQLLGAVIEAVTGETLPAIFAARIFEPLAMSDTYILGHSSQTRPAPVPLYYKAERRDLPLALASMASDGGGVWTLRDGLRFLRAYFAGELFSQARLAEAMDWNALFFPFQYGHGLMRFKLPRWLTLFRDTPEFIGHSGTCGAWAFYAPKEDLYLVGSVSQMEGRQRPFRIMPKVVAALS